MSIPATSVRSARDVKRNLIRMAFERNSSGVVVRIQERLKRLNQDTQGSAMLIAKFNFENFTLNQEERAKVLASQKEGQTTCSPFSFEFENGFLPN